MASTFIKLLSLILSMTKKTIGYKNFCHNISNEQSSSFANWTRNFFLNPYKTWMSMPIASVPRRKLQKVEMKKIRKIFSWHVDKLYGTIFHIASLLWHNSIIKVQAYTNLYQLNSIYYNILENCIPCYYVCTKNTKWMRNENDEINQLKKNYFEIIFFHVASFEN